MDLRAPSGKPGIINHPFRWRWARYRELLKAGPAPLPQIEFLREFVGKLVQPPRLAKLS